MTRRAGSPIGVGVIGLGFMGRTHLAAYRSARAAGFDNAIVAVADRGRAGKRKDRSARGNLDTGDDGGALFDPERTRRYADAHALLADDAVELVSICTHTPTHVELAIAALEAGKHVLVEKPIATDAASARRLARAAERSDRRCMPAMCIRFWPAWRWLLERIRARTFGAVQSAVFRRLAAPPSWSQGFYADAGQSGGALFDLHVHDADFVLAAFGAPSAVTSTGTLNHVTTLYRYPNGPAHVVAEGAWDLGPGFPFEMNFTVVFERATADFRLGRTPELELYAKGSVRRPELEAGNGYEGQVRHLLAAIRRPKSALAATCAEAWTLTRLLEAERKSLATAKPVRFG